MVLTAHQGCYLPYLGLFHKIAMADRFVFFDDVQYQPKDWNNRNRIKFPDGSAKWLSVPVSRKGYLDKSYLDIEIDNRQPWARKHWKSIEQCYRKAPYWDRHRGAFDRVYNKLKWDKLWHLNKELLAHLMAELGIARFASDMVRLSELGVSGEKSELVLNMCKAMGATKYVFGAQGRDYADLQAFERAGIEVVFQDYIHPVYQQLHGEFVSHLSVIDLLFNHGPESLKIIMAGNVDKEHLSRQDTQRED